MVGQEELADRAQGRKPDGGKVPVSAAEQGNHGPLVREIGRQEQAQLSEPAVAFLINLLPFGQVE